MTTAVIQAVSVLLAESNYRTWADELWGLVSGHEKAPVMPLVPGITRATTDTKGTKAHCPEREKSEAVNVVRSEGYYDDEVGMLL